jgi:hypothetical protein
MSFKFIKEKRKRDGLYFVNKQELDEFFDSLNTPEFIPITKIGRGNDMTKLVKITVEEI